MKRKFLFLMFSIFFIFAGVINAENFSKQALEVKKAFENYLKPKGVNVKIVLDKDIPDKEIKNKLKNFRLVSLKLWKGKRQQIFTCLTDGKFIIRDIEIAGKPMNLVSVYQVEAMKYKIKINNDELISGKPNAKVKIVVFGDFECPFCKRAMKFILDNYKDNPDVAIYFKHFPLPFHRYAKPMSKVFIAGKMVGVNLINFLENFKIPRGKKVEEVEKALIDNATTMIPDNKKGLFLKFVEDKNIMKKVDENIAEGKELGVTGTPTIFINGKKVVGMRPNMIKKFVDEELKNGKN